MRPRHSDTSENQPITLDFHIGVRHRQQAILNLGEPSVNLSRRPKHAISSQHANPFEPQRRYFLESVHRFISGHYSGIFRHSISVNFR